MRQSKRNAFTLVELLVVIAIIGTLVGLLLPAVQAAREAARANTCRSNMTNLQKAITQREQTQGKFPGYINLVGPAGDDLSNKLRASWVVTTFPYIEQPQLWDTWTRGRPSGNIGDVIDDLYSPLELLICPSDPPETQGEPVLSYAANAGFIQDELQSRLENPANGVFTDQARVLQTGQQLPQDYKDTASEPHSLVGMTSAYIGSKGDGLTNTIMLSENLQGYLWGYGLGNHTSVQDKKYHFGVCWEDPDAVDQAPTNAVDEYKTGTSYRKINGQRVDNAVLFTTFADETNSGMQPNYGFPSSNHSGGVNMAFCGGAVKFVTDEITPTVYAQLMTSNRKGSNLKDLDGTLERKLKQPSDDDF